MCSHREAQRKLRLRREEERPEIKECVRKRNSNAREHILHELHDVPKENPISNRHPLRQYTGRYVFSEIFNKNLCMVEVLRMNYNEIFEYMHPY
jgi:hypothetical protein